MKRLLIDLSMLRHPYCGLGQVALNYGRWYSCHAVPDPEIEVTLLVPKGYVGAFGDGVGYLEAKTVYRLMPWLMPHYDMWHSTHQLSPFRPSDKTTLRLTTLHDLNFLYEKPPHKQRRYLSRLQYEVDRSSALAFISHYAHEDAQRHLSLAGKPTRVIYNGVAATEEAMEEKAGAMALPEPYFLTMGVVKAKKNLGVLLPLMERMPDHHLLIAGDDHDQYAEELRRTIAEKHLDNVHLTGIVNEMERRQLYRRCSALLFPSLCEGFGLPMIEAMSYGKAVFASPCTSLPEIGGRHAYYFDSFDPQKMEVTIREGLSAYTDEKATAAQTYAATFDYDTHINRYWQYYRELIQM